MTNVPKVRLGDVVEIDSGFAFDSARFNDDCRGIPLVRIRDVQRGRSNTWYDGPSDAKYDVANGDILVGMDGEFNISRWRGGAALLNQRVCRIRVGSKVAENYALHFLPAALKKIEDETPFVTVKHLSTKVLKDISFPLPSLSEQRRIAAILDQADALRTKRRHVQAKLASLVNATYLDLFGKPDGAAQWPLTKLASLIAGFESGKSNVADDLDYQSKYRVLKVSAIGRSGFRADESKPLPETYDPPASHFVAQGDLLFSRANTSELVGAVAYVWDETRDLVLPDKIWRFRWLSPSPVAPLFLHALLSQPTVRQQISQRATGTSGSMKNISQEKLLGIELRVPPLPLQNHFSDLLRRLRHGQNVASSASEQADALFASLQHRAFRGEL